MPDLILALLASAALLLVVAALLKVHTPGHDESVARRIVDADRRLEAAIDARVTAFGHRLQAWASETLEATAAIAAHLRCAVDDSAPVPRTAPLLAASMSGPLGLPHPVRLARHAVRGAVDRAEAQLRDVFPHGRSARHAATAFVASSVLGAAGLAAAATLLTASVPLPASPIPAAAPAVAAHAEPAEPAPDALPATDTGAAAAASTPAVPADQEAAPTVRPAHRRGAIPVGKGMWIWQPTAVEGGDPVAIVSRAKAVGLTHVYVRTGSTRDGFYAQDFLNALLPVAHANGIRVFGWDFPHLDRPGDDVARAWAAITYRTPDGHRIDGFAPDIETPSEGTNNDPGHAAAYGEWLRTAVGPHYPLIAVVPRPSAPTLARGYPYTEVVRHYDAIAPMVYWMDKDPGVEVANAINYLSQFGKPIIPIGQAYDGGIDGGPGGRPSPQALIRFMQVSWQLGAPATSFWSWQHADQATWDTIRDAGEFRLPAWEPAALNPSMIRAYQHLLTSLGHGVPASGVWDPATADAVRSYQQAVRLPQTGVIDEATLRALLTPFKPPLPPGVDPS